MLRFLRIRHLAVIEAVEVEFAPGLNVLTGETGAGKSILVQAVGLLLGGRATNDVVRTGEEAAIVEAVFESGGEEVVVRREVTAQGRSRAFVDGSLVTAAVLREKTAGLMEIHGQHEHQTLLNSAAHQGIVDLFGGLDSAVAAVAEAYTALTRVTGDLEALRESAADADARREFAAFQLSELDRAQLVGGEDEALGTERQVLANAERLERLCREMRSVLYESDHAVLATLATVWRKLGELAAIDAAFAPYVEQKSSIKAQLEDLADALRGYLDRLDAPPGRLQQVEDRLAFLERLRRRHGPSLADVIVARERLRDAVNAFGATHERVAALERGRAEAQSRYADAAGTLSAERRRAAARLAPEIERRLRSLAMEKARFEVRFLAPEPGQPLVVSAHGSDQIEFFIAPNPGEDPRALARTASGGELSRIMLGLKTLTARRAGPDATPVGMIFDEIDAGIGGAVADVVGRELQMLAGSAQVLCITHLPQVAAYAGAHFRITKAVRQGRTATSVARLDPDERVDELARMIGGSTVTDGIRRSARELLTGRAWAKGEHSSKGESESVAPLDRPPTAARKRR